MGRQESCPSCGTKLAGTNARVSMRTCDACHRSNPAGFDYCGFCASPMETTEMRAHIAELAAPPGGWPNLTGELVEVRFYLQQGLFDDAYELLSIMQKRHPGHPQLTELTHRRKTPARRVDTETLALVDSVLAESANLMGKMPRRAAPRWKAPTTPDAPPTGVHAPAPEVPARRSGKTGPNATARGRDLTEGSGAVAAPRAAAARVTAPQRSAPRPNGAPRVASRESTVEPPPARERTQIYRTVEPPRTTVEARAAESRGAARTSDASRGGKARDTGASRVAARETSTPRAAVRDTGASRAAAARDTGSARRVGARDGAPARGAGARDTGSSRSASAREAEHQHAAREQAARVAAQEQQAAREAERARAARAAERHANARAAERAAAERAAARAAKTIASPSRGGPTVVVDALQPPAPWSASPAEAEATERAPKGGRKRRDAPAPAAPAASSTPASASTDDGEPKKESRRGRASFGEHVLNRLR